MVFHIPKESYLKIKLITLINTAMGLYGPHFCKGLIDAVWCDNVGSQTHSNSANMLYIYQGRYVVFVVIGFWFLYDLY